MKGESNMDNKIMDWAGEYVDKDSCPPCTKHGCFACVEGCCTALRIPDSRRSKKADGGRCGFYQPIQKVKESGIRGYRRLKEIGRRDLIGKYADTLIVTGAMDDEIQEADQEAESFDRFRETDFNKQLDKMMAEETAVLEGMRSRAGA